MKTGSRKINHSITLRLIVNLGAALLIFGAIIAMYLQFFLGGVVTSTNRNNLADSVNAIWAWKNAEGIDFDTAGEADSELRKMIVQTALDKNIQIIVYKLDETLCSTAQDPPALVKDKELKNTRLPEETYFTAYHEADGGRIHFLVYERRYDLQYTVQARSHYAAIESNVLVANNFIRLIIVAALVFALFWAFMFSRRFTKPVIQMTETARALSNLNFDKRCEAESDDELGQLAASINEMSDKLRDAIGRLKSQNERLAADLEREKQLEQAQKKLISDVSHELKTPLTIISGYAESLKSAVNKSESKRAEYSAVILDEAGKMTRLVHNILNLSQIRSGQHGLTETEFRIDELVAGVASRFFAVSGGGARMEIRTEPCVVRADELKVEQVVNNFLSNAVSHAGGEKTINITGTVQESGYRIGIYNTGEPIGEGDIDKIWDPFYKADKARARRDGRYGIGLSIVRAIVEQHGGTYGVSNKPQGVEFYVTIPINTVVYGENKI